MDDSFHWVLTEDESYHKQDDDTGAILPDTPEPQPEPVLDSHGQVAHYEEEAA